MKFKYDKQLSKLLWESNVLRKDFWSNFFFKRKQRFITNKEFSRFLKNTFPTQGSAFWVLEELDWVDYNLQRINKAVYSRTKFSTYRRLSSAGFHYKNLLLKKYYTVVFPDVENLFSKREDIFKKSEDSSTEEGFDLFLMRQFSVQSNLRWLFVSDFLNKILEGDKFYTGVSRWSLFFFKYQQQVSYGTNFFKFKHFTHFKEQAKVQTYFYFLSKKNIMFFSNFSKLSLFYRILNSPVSVDYWVRSGLNRNMHFSGYLPTYLNKKSDYVRSYADIGRKYLISSAIITLRYPYYLEKNLAHSRQTSGFNKSILFNPNSEWIFLFGNSRIPFTDPANYLVNSVVERSFLRIFNFSCFFFEFLSFRTYNFHEFNYLQMRNSNFKNLSIGVRRKLFNYYSSTHPLTRYKQMTRRVFQLDYLFDLNAYKNWLNWKISLCLFDSFNFRRVYSNKVGAFFVDTNFLELRWDLSQVLFRPFKCVWFANTEHYKNFNTFSCKASSSFYFFLFNSVVLKFAVIGDYKKYILPLTPAVFKYRKFPLFPNSKWFFHYNTIFFEWKEDIDDFFIFVNFVEFWERRDFLKSKMYIASQFNSFFHKFSYIAVWNSVNFTMKSVIVDLLAASYYNFFEISHSTEIGFNEAYYKIISTFLLLITKKFNFLGKSLDRMEQFTPSSFGVSGLAKLTNFVLTPTPTSQLFLNSLSVSLFSKIPLFYNHLWSFVFSNVNVSQLNNSLSAMSKFFFVRYLSVNYTRYISFLRQSVFGVNFFDNNGTPEFVTPATTCGGLLLNFKGSNNYFLNSQKFNDSSGKRNLSDFCGDGQQSFFYLLQASESGAWSWIKENEVYFVNSKNYVGNRVAALPLIRGGLSSLHTEFFFFYSNKDRLVYKNYMRKCLSIKSKGKFTPERGFKITLFSEYELFDRISNRLLYDLNFSGGVKSLTKRSHLFQRLQTPLTQSLEKLMSYEFLNFEKDMYFNFFDSSWDSFYADFLLDKDTSYLLSYDISSSFLVEYLDLFRLDSFSTIYFAEVNSKLVGWRKNYWDGKLVDFFLLFEV